MPRSALKPCFRAPACGALVPRGVKGCKVHGESSPAERQHDLDRGSAASRGYGPEWRRRRDAHLRGEPLCRECAKTGRVTTATDVDHIVSRANGGTEHPANLQSLCHEHHSAKTAREDGGFGRKRTEVNP